MNNNIVSPIKDEDIPLVLEINNLCFDPPWSLTSLKNEVANKFTKYIVLKSYDVVVGYVGIWLILDEAHITNIAIHPNHRCKGLGSILMENTVNLCKELNIPSITLEVRENNTAAKNLYKKFGFTEQGIRKNYYPNNINAIIMWKRDILSK